MKTNLKKITLVIICSLIFCASHAQDSLAFNIGYNSFLKGNAQDAIYWFSKSIEKNYLPAQSYMYRGASNTYQGNNEQALPDLFYSYKLDSTLPYTCQFIGTAYLSLSKFDSCILWLDKAIKKDPKDPDAYNNRAVAYRTLQQLDKATADVELALTISPNNRMYLINRGAIKQAQLNYEEALDDYKAALKIDASVDNNIIVYINMGICNASLNALEEALANVDKVLSRYPDVGEALEARGQIYEAMGRKDEACADFEKLKPIDSTIANGYLDKYCR